MRLNRFSLLLRPSLSLSPLSLSQVHQGGRGPLLRGGGGVNRGAHDGVQVRALYVAHPRLRHRPPPVHHPLPAVGFEVPKLGAGVCGLVKFVRWYRAH